MAAKQYNYILLEGLALSTNTNTKHVEFYKNVELNANNTRNSLNEASVNGGQNIRARSHDL